MEQNETKYCPSCKTYKPIENFCKEGRNRFDKNGNVSRRRICSSCLWKRKKERSILKKTINMDRERNLVNSLIELGRHDIERIAEISKYQFINKTNSSHIMNEIDYEKIKTLAIQELLERGYHRPEVMHLHPGVYLVVGDAHGMHTEDRMFQLLRQLVNFLHVDNIIHIGHLLDDDNEISRHWEDFENVIVLAKMEEAKIIEDKLKEKNNKFNFDIVRQEIIIGDYHICNQDLIRDYVNTFIGNLDPEIFPSRTITHLHRHEFDVRCSFSDRSIIMSPGCLCEQHILRTIKQIDFSTGCQIKVAYHDGFIKYRRMRHGYQYWQQGAIVVHFDGRNTTCIPIRIKKIGEHYATSYFDKIITDEGVKNPDKKIFVNGDIHVNYHDDNVLEIQEKICLDYKPDIFITLGDTFNCSSLNHHDMDKGKVIVNQDILTEMCNLNFILQKMSKWAPEKYIFFGNHERFLRDFSDKYPQLKRLFDFKFLSGIDDLGYKFLGYKDVLEIGKMRFIHGDMKMFGSKGRRMERASRVFHNCIMGHIHYPSTRFGCYSVGLSGILNHDYNEPNASNWTHSAILCNQYKGESFVSHLVIMDNKILINNRLYSANNSNFSKFTTSNIKIIYTFDG